MTALEFCIDGAATPADTGGAAADGDAVDAALVRRCARRDPDALRALVRRHQPRIYGFLARLLGSPEDAEEAAQDVFLRAWLGADRFGGRAAVATWLYRIAANVAADRLRRRKAQRHTVPLSDDTPGMTAAAPDDPAWAGLERHERARQLHEALGTLRAGDRLLLVLYYAEEKGYAEIGVITGHPYPVLKMRLLRARKRLRAAWDALTAEGKRMNCRTFERQVPDWLAGRLSQNESEPMASHRAACAACAALTRAEERLREGWRAADAVALPAPDLWPRLSARLDEAACRQRTRTVALRGRLALGALSLALAAAVAGLSVRPGTPPPAPPTFVARTPGPVSALPDVSLVDPAVDDPVGGIVDEEWQQIHTARAGTGADR